MVSSVAVSYTLSIFRGKIVVFVVAVSPVGDCCLAVGIALGGMMSF